MSKMTFIRNLNPSVRGMLSGPVQLHKTRVNVVALLLIPQVRSKVGTDT